MKIKKEELSEEKECINKNRNNNKKESQKQKCNEGPRVTKETKG